MSALRRHASQRLYADTGHHEVAVEGAPIVEHNGSEPTFAARLLHLRLLDKPHASRGKVSLEGCATFPA